jgi:hypothetical protein
MNYDEIASNYLLDRANADRSAALTSLSILLHHPAGIGDHSTDDLHNNLDDALRKLADADDRIKTIKTYLFKKEEEKDQE